MGLRDRQIRLALEMHVDGSGEGERLGGEMRFEIHPVLIHCTCADPGTNDCVACYCAHRSSLPSRRWYVCCTCPISARQDITRLLTIAHLTAPGRCVQCALRGARAAPTPHRSRPKTAA